MHIWLAMSQNYTTYPSGLHHVLSPCTLRDLRKQLLPMRPSHRMEPIDTIPRPATTPGTACVRLPLRIALGAQDLPARKHLCPCDAHPSRRNLDLQLLRLSNPPRRFGRRMCRRCRERLELHGHRGDCVEVFVDDVQCPECSQEGVNVEPSLACLGEPAVIGVIRRGVAGQDGLSARLSEIGIVLAVYLYLGSCSKVSLGDSVDSSWR